MAMVCSACDVDLCDFCGHGCECRHDHPWSEDKLNPANRVLDAA